MSSGSDELSERKQKILRAIVDAHIEGGEPVGSKALTQISGLTCSPATIRNEMAELESLGYLEHPYTSSGRIPSDLGYRFYVDSLLQQYRMTSQEIAELNRLMQTKMAEMRKLLEHATKIASQFTNYTGLAVLPGTNATKISHCEVLYLNPRAMVLVVVTSQNDAKSRYLDLDFECSKEACDKLNLLLNRYLAGCTAEQITISEICQMEAQMEPDDRLVSVAVKAIYRLLDDPESGDVHVEGMNRLLQYPEYSDVSRLKEMMHLFEQKEDLLQLVSGSEDDNTHVYIGSENAVDSMSKSTLIFRTIKNDGRVVGAIGIVGPSRMNYSRVIATVEQISGTISDMIDPKAHTALPKETENHET